MYAKTRSGKWFGVEHIDVVEGQQVVWLREGHGIVSGYVTIEEIVEFEGEDDDDVVELF